MRPFILAIAVVSVAAGQVTAQNVKGKPQPGSTRFAVVNIGLVFNSYERAQLFKQDLEKMLAPYKQKGKKLSDEIKECEADIQNGAAGKIKEKLHTMISKNKKDLEDMAAEIQQLLGKKQEDNLVELWKDVQTGIRIYANQNNIDVVFGYGDPMDKELLDLFPNVNRKMQAMDLGSTVPLFVTPRAEIGEAVVELLNNQYRELKKKGPAKLRDPGDPS